MTPCKIVNHEYFNLKLGTRDYVVDINHHASFGSKRFSRGFSPNRGNISLFVTFFVILPFFVGHAPTSNRRTDSYGEWLKRRVSNQGRYFWGSGRWVTSYGENMPQKLSNRGVNRQFQAKTPKSIHRDISRSINPTNKRFEDRV